MALRHGNRHLWRALAPAALGLLAALGLGACGSGHGRTATVSVDTTPPTSPLPTPSQSQIGTVRHSGRIALTVTRLSTAPSLTYVGGTRSVVTPNARSRTSRAPAHFSYLSVRTRVTNHGASAVNLACGSALRVAVGDDRKNTYTPVEGLAEVRGNPGCGDPLKPGATTAMTWVFLTNDAGKAIAFAFAAPGSASSPTIVTL